ncbi:HK97 gp10 family phage protein [Actinophytocola sp. NPDC049390]|uniref:HK97 gp10 family phage protein n=1 Tax=Actinophytocola sp. NPDC049390 TaxID=3363894 RepID=UPI00379BF9F5
MIDVSKTSIDDMRALLREIKKLAPETRKKLQRKLRASVNKTAAKIRTKQPKQSGLLRRRTRAGARAGRAEIRARAPYSRIVERGGKHPVFGEKDKAKWVYQEPQPAIFPTVVEDQPTYFNDANRALAEALREIKFQ